MFLLSPPSPEPTTSMVPDIDEVSTKMVEICKEDTVLCSVLARWMNNSPWASLLATAITIAVILIIGFVIRNLVNRVITRVVHRAASRPVGLLRKGPTTAGVDALLHERRRQRAETMGSVLKHVATVVIIGTTVLTVLDRLAIPIAPLLTSVGILGVAIGFGAQELVKDFIAGMFMLLEDQYGVGDVIDAGTAVGTVEAVTLRVTRLRDEDGRVWYVRNGTITRVGNESQGWSRAYIDVPVPYDSDVTTVRVVLEHVAEEMWADSELRQVAIVEPPKVYGVEQLSDSSMVFRLAAKTLPASQEEVGRELRLRVKTALDAADITMVG